HLMLCIVSVHRAMGGQLEYRGQLPRTGMIAAILVRGTTPRATTKRPRGGLTENVSQIMRPNAPDGGSEDSAVGLGLGLGHGRFWAIPGYGFDLDISLRSFCDIISDA